MGFLWRVQLYAPIREAGWGRVAANAFYSWDASVFTVDVPVAVWPEGALCDPAKMVFTDPS